MTTGKTAFASERAQRRPAPARSRRDAGRSKGRIGRPSKLTADQWAEISRRILAGESARALGREFGVSPATISERLSERISRVRKVAGQMVSAETAFSDLDVSEQLEARTLAEELKAISAHLASAAKYGSMTAHRLSRLAHGQSALIAEGESFKDSAPVLQSVAALTATANEAAKIGQSLLAANRKGDGSGENDGRVKGGKGVAGLLAEMEEIRTTDPHEALKAYQKLIG